MFIAQPLLSFQPLATQHQHQLAQVNTLLAYLEKNAPFYKRHLANQGKLPQALASLAHLQQLPTTTKEMMQQHNMDFLCVPHSEVVEYTATSGTLGRPVTIALTENDLQRLAYNEQQSFTTAGITNEDVVQLLLTLDKQFMAGMAYYLGLRNIGAATVRTGPGVPALQWDVAQRLNTTAWVAVPSFVVKLIDFAVAQGIDFKRLPIKSIICIGEPLRNEQLQLNVLGKRIAEQWPVQLHGTYAATEMQSAFTECAMGNGGHLQPDLLVVEILDEDGQQLPPGEVGEITITTLGIEGIPLLRYRTGDLAAYYDEPCACGRHSVRLGAVVGRKQQMIKLKGTTLYPPALFEVMNELREVAGYVVEVSKDALGNDDLCLHLHTNIDTETCILQVNQALSARLRVKPKLQFITAQDLQQLQFPEGNRKAVRWIDNR